MAHGSPDPRHQIALELFAEQVQLTLGSPVEVGFLDHNRPSVTEVLTSTEPGTPVSVVGLFLADGYHVRVDVPRVLADTGAPVTDCGPLGLGDWLLPALNRAAAEASSGDSGPSGVVLVAAGSSRQEARDEITALAGRWQVQREAPVRAAFATGSGPTIDEALTMLDETDCSDRVVVPLLLAPGSMSDRVLDVSNQQDVPVAQPLLDSTTPTELIARVLDLVQTSGTRQRHQS